MKHPFVITSDARDGSGMLSTALNYHPDIKVYGEVFGSGFVPQWHLFRNAEELLEYGLYNFRQPQRCVGFKLFSWHAREGRYAEARSCLRQRGVRVIHLQRRNLLRKYISHRLAHETGVWHICSRHLTRRATLCLDFDAACAYFERTQAAYARHQHDFAGLPACILYYEDLVSHYQAEMQRVLGFLGVHQDVVLWPDTLCQEVRPLAEILTNYEGLRARWASTPWVDFFVE